MSVRRGQRWGLTDGFGYDPEDDPADYDPRQDRDHSAGRPVPPGPEPSDHLRPMYAVNAVTPCTWCIPGEPCAFHRDVEPCPCVCHIELGGGAHPGRRCRCNGGDGWEDDRP